MTSMVKMLKNKKGAVNIIVIIGLIGILGSLALVIDVGFLFLEKSKLSNAADAAVLAGAQELPFDKNEAINIANHYGEVNGASLNKINIVITEGNSKIEANINNDVVFAFSKILGFDKANVMVSSAAMVGPVTEVYDGIRPLVVEHQSFIYGQRVILKEGAGDGYKGNYGAVALGGSGANVYRNNIKLGYNGKLKIGDIIYTEPGNMSGPTVQGVEYITDRDNSNFNNFARDSLRIWTIPVVESLQVNGRKPVVIVGFAVFFLEDAKKKSGKTEITGRFIEFVTNGDIDTGQSDYGLKGVKLIK
ncbi:MAG: pilus assembly protein TadG-related protein [Maledivibacter sp.]|nr:pilus assembly protein TadG-related protein [Maledivibacter sp.]